MAGPTDVKQLLLQVDASVELLRRNLNAGQARVDQFAGDTTRRLDTVDRRFGQLGRPLGNLTGSIAGTRRDIAAIGASVEQAESRIRRSASGIKAALLGSASGVAAAFSVDRIKEYADGYTRYTNQLKVAGLEGAQLGKVQNDLYEIAQRYGVQLESVGTLYGRLKQGAKELGASQADLLRFTSGVGAALKVQGGDAAASAGALMQLTQALGGEIVRAEEFNSINEGARPILQAVANGIDRFGGSVAKLRGEVIEGKVTSREFFEAFLKGSGSLEQQATKANLTIGASFVVLNNALGKYIGEADASLSATERVSAAITGIANNLDTVATALTVIGAGFATRFAVGPVAAAAAQIVLMTKALDSERLVMIGGKVAAAQKAEAVAASARVEVASIEATIVARRADQASLQQSLALIEAQRAAALQAQAAIKTNQALGFGTAVGYGRNDALRANQDLKAQITTKRALQVVNAELAATETALAAAQTRAAAATTVASTAAAEASLTARAAAASSRAFAGALTLIGGSVAGGAAVLAIGALVAAVLHANSEMKAAEERNRATAGAMRDTAEAGRELNNKLKELAGSAVVGASAVAQVGASSAASIGQVLSFAGAVGQAADKLYALAKARRHEQVVGLTTDSVSAEQRANAAQARINERNRAGTFATATGSGVRLSDADRKANADDARIVAENRRQQQAAYQAAQRASAIPLASRISETDRTGGRDVAGELVRVRRDLVIAREGGNKAQIADLKAQQFELTQYQKYRKSGLSVEASNAAAQKDAGEFRGGSSARADRDAGRRAGIAQRKSEAAAAKAERQEAAAVRDSAADARAYSAAERQANNDIAAARADLTNSAVERAAIERSRIEGERENRNGEIENQAKQGGLGTGDEANKRKLELQRLNNDRAALETQVVDAREQQRVADEALALAQAGRGNQAELLQAQANLATTASERRQLELAILDITYDEEQARLEGLIASRDASESEKKIAAARLAMLGQLKDGDRQNIERQNAGPLDQYRERLRSATGSMNESLQGVAVDGLTDLEDGLTGLVTGTESVSSAFKKMAKSILADLARIAIQRAIVSAIGGSGFFGLKLAGGGKVEGKAGGGRIVGPGSGTSDSIPALIDGQKPLLVSNGESIVTAAATSRWWPQIDAMNKGRVPRFAAGGVIGRVPTLAATAPRLASLARAGGMGGKMVVDANVTVSSTPELEAKMEGVSVRTVGAAAEPIMAGATSRTLRRLSRDELPGGIG